MVSHKRVVKAFLKASEPSINDLQSTVQSIGAKIKSAFKYTIPNDVEWRTSDHPDYTKDQTQTGTKDPAGFITRDWKKIYVDLNKLKDVPLKEFVAHEIGHFLDKHLGGGSYLSSGLGIKGLKDSPHEAFAMMVDFVINDGHPGGPGQTEMYNAVIDKAHLIP